MGHYPFLTQKDTVTPSCVLSVWFLTGSTSFHPSSLPLATEGILTNIWSLLTSIAKQTWLVAMYSLFYPVTENTGKQRVCSKASLLTLFDHSLQLSLKITGSQRSAFEIKRN